MSDKTGIEWTEARRENFCARCGIYDYGERGGPAHRECYVECGYQPEEYA